MEATAEKLAKQGRRWGWKGWRMWWAVAMAAALVGWRPEAAEANNNRVYELDESGERLEGEFLARQNEARAEVGEAPLVWSPQLARYAEWWAAQNAMSGDCGLHHSGGPYGENIFWGSGREWSAADAVSDWANEKQWYSYFFNACAFYDSCGHYTQMVWKSTKYVGCARVTCSDGNVFINCNYYPPGNYLGQRPY